MFFDYDNITLIPEKGIVESRQDCDTKQRLGRFEFKLPVVPANMKTVINQTMAEYLASNGYFYIMHRFFSENPIQNNEEILKFINHMKELELYVSISIGVKKHDYMLINMIKHLNIEFITIDIAHGHCEMMEKMIKYIREHMGYKVFIIAGNICTRAAVRDLEKWGADATKVGIGPGRVCTTKLKTGFGSGGWQLGCVNYCSEVARRPVIADGGVKYNGDVAKAIRFGATFVMIGGLFARLSETSGNVVEIDGRRFKEYYGSASQFNNTKRKNIEGKRILEEIRENETLESFLQEMTEDLQSSISYAGGRELRKLKYVKYVLI